MMEVLVLVYLAGVLHNLNFILVVGSALGGVCVVLLYIGRAIEALEQFPINMKKLVALVCVVGGLAVLTPSANLIYAFAAFRVSENVAQTEVAQQAGEWLKLMLTEQLKSMTKKRKGTGDR